MRWSPGYMPASRINAVIRAEVGLMRALIAILLLAAGGTATSLALDRTAILP